jgi:uncharacterized protein involved in response to NO
MTASLTDRWVVLTSAPHRMFFATGLAWLAAWSAWWLLVLGARAAGLDGLEPARPGLLLHGGIMLFLVLPPFMYGFLLTVFPRWMPAPPPGRTAMLTAWWLLNGGNLAMLTGLAGPLWLQWLGWLFAAAAKAVVITTLLRVLLRARERAPHAFAVLIGLGAGLAGMLLFTPVLVSGNFSTWPLVRGIGLWAFLLVVYFGVSHRMIPFFTSRVVRDYVSWRPDWILYLFVAFALVRAGLELVPARAWLASVPLAVIAITCVLRWRPRQRAGVRLLDVLHISLAWLAVGLALAAAADLAAALGAPGLVGRAPLHALGMGFIGGMLIAMVTRVTLGHSGRPLALDGLNWRLFLGVQAAAVLRIAGEFLPGAGPALGALAALTWVLVFGTWTARLLPIYLRPRADGVPG